LNLSRNFKVNKEIAQKSRAIAFIFLSLLLKKATKRDYLRCKTTNILANLTRLLALVVKEPE
jgi:hypothetical protein